MISSLYYCTKNAFAISLHLKNIMPNMKLKILHEYND